MPDLGLQVMRLALGRDIMQSRCAASVWPTPEMSSFSPSMVSSATRRIAAGSTGLPRWVISPLRQRVADENGIDGLQIELGGEVHHGEILVVEFAVLLRRIAVAVRPGD